MTAPEINHGTSAVVFRTDHKLAGGSNGGTLKGRAGVDGANSSIGTVRGAAGHPCSVGYVVRSLKVGHEYEVVIAIGDTEYHRTLTLRHSATFADRGADLHC